MFSIVSAAQDCRLCAKSKGETSLFQVGFVTPSSAVPDVSMMFVPTYAFDVVERIGSVAEEALVHLRMFLAGHHFRNHREMLHVVAGRSLVTLCAIA